MESSRKKVNQGCIVIIFMLTAIFFNAFTVIAASESDYKSKYMGQEKREIKSLSNEDIKELRTGAGWGLAKAAELNGLPGPKHVLEMKKETIIYFEQLGFGWVLDHMILKEINFTKLQDECITDTSLIKIIENMLIGNPNF